MSLQDFPPKPSGDPAIRTLAMPADTNANGDIFGGWLMSQMDLAGAIVAYPVARGRVVTVGVEAMTFHAPVHVGDVVSLYGKIERIGRTSIRVKIQAWARRNRLDIEEPVTEGIYTYVAIDEDKRPREIPKP